MSASSKFDLSSSSPDRPLYASTQRGSYAPTASLDRSGSFREIMENPILSALPNMTRSTSTVTRTDAVNFFQCLRFDPKAMVTDHKLNRVIDFKRLTSLTLGVPVEDSPLVSSKGKLFPSPSVEEARQLKTGLRESCTKARERVKIFTESLSVLNKCFPSIPSRKRSRSDALSNDRSMTFSPSDRSVSGTGIGKTGTQSHCSPIGYEFEQQKSEERVKNSVPSKRTRTSMADVRPDLRANTPTRTARSIDRDRELLRFPNGSAIQGGDHTPSIAVEGWEKLRMKKKRSGIKPDATSSMMAKPIDGHREPKQGVQPRLPSDNRSRFTDNGFRPGVTPGGVGKADGAAQQVTLGIRSSLSKVDQDNHPHLPDRRDRPLGSDKERVNLRTVNNTMKAAAREDFASPSPTSSTKLNPATRAPRSGSGVAPKLSPPVQRAAAANDWEISHCTNKLPSAVGTGNRKLKTRSSSPPVAQWTSQRPQKISRPARRNNFLIVPNNDEISTLDSTSDVLRTERRLSNSSPQQKLKSDLFSPAVSETEELGAAEIKSKDKSKRSDEVDEKAGNVQKMSTLLLPPRKNKVVSGEDYADGVRRQGRSGRGFTSARSLMPLMAEKLNVGTAKQLRTSRHALDKTESKGGRPPTRKLSDRRAYKRQKHATMDAAADFLVGSDDGHEELLAAASAVANTTQALSSSFWKQMEPLFRFISELDAAFLRQQVNHETDLVAPASLPFDADASSSISVFGLSKVGGQKSETWSFDLTSEHVVSGKSKPKGISLYQRMMATLVPEELYCNGKEDLNSNVYRSGIEMEMDSESNASCAQMLNSRDVSQYCASNGFKINSNGCSIDKLDDIKADNVTSVLEGDFSSYNQSQNGLLSEHQTVPGFVCSEYQYDEMSIDERLLLEIHYIGIYPDLESDLAETGNEEISSEICKLQEKHQEMVSKKKRMLGKLLNSSTEMREFQEKEFEQRALDKLVAMAYEKYMICWGPNAHGMKSASGKMAKQAALAFVKRTLHRCQQFDETRKSCFSEHLYKDMFLSGISRLNDGQTDSNTDGEAGKSYISTSGCSGEAIVSVVQKEKEVRETEKEKEMAERYYPAMERLKLVDLPLPMSREKRKPKTKAKQKTAPLSTSVNGLFGRMSEPKLPGSSIAKSSGTSATGTGNDNNDCNLDELEDPIDLSGLQLPEMDVLGVPDDLGGQGQDIGSWLNIDDDGLQDHDFLGLEIPMDDLSDLNMMV
ncbi:unnamed protein product [Withania somnifera]